MVAKLFFINNHLTGHQNVLWKEKKKKEKEKVQFSFSFLSFLSSLQIQVALSFWTPYHNKAEIPLCFHQDKCQLDTLPRNETCAIYLYSERQPKKKIIGF